MKEEDLVALPWINGPESGGIRGFGFKDEDDPQRYQVVYSSLHEKLWCEASGLLMFKLWDEAEEKVAELSGYLGQRDSDLEAKLTYGIAMRDVNSGGDEPPVGIIDEHKFEAARRALRFQISRDEGGNIDELCGMLYDLVEARIRAFVPSENRWNDAEKTEPYWVLDYGAATLQALLKAATLWLEVPKAATIVFANLSDFNDNPHDKTHCIVDELAKRGEFKRARKVAGDILKVDPGMSEFYRNIFWAAVAECSEALGETAIAHESYVKLKDCDPEFYDDNEKMSLFEDVSPGTLDERITRSTMNASMDS